MLALTEVLSIVGSETLNRHDRVKKKVDSNNPESYWPITFSLNGRNDAGSFGKVALFIVFGRFQGSRGLFLYIDGDGCLLIPFNMPLESQVHLMIANLGFLNHTPHEQNHRTPESFNLPKSRLLSG